MTGRVPDAAATGEVAERIRASRSGRLSPLYATLLHNEAIAEGWALLGTGVRFQTSLKPRVLELAACMVVRVTGGEYEWRTHCPLALEAGVTQEQLEALPNWRVAADIFSGEERAVLDYVTAVVEGTVTDDLHAAVAEHFSPTALVELAATVCYFVAVARFTDAFGLSS